jgi:hypothetical protein
MALGRDAVDVEMDRLVNAGMLAAAELALASDLLDDNALHHEFECRMACRFAENAARGADKLRRERE